MNSHTYYTHMLTFQVWEHVFINIIGLFAPVLGSQACQFFFSSLHLASRRDREVSWWTKSQESVGDWCPFRWVIWISIGDMPQSAGVVTGKIPLFVFNWSVFFKFRFTRHNFQKMFFFIKSKFKPGKHVDVLTSMF